MLSSDLAPTRSAVLQLREERDVILEAYDFLDEKRLLLAAELLRQLKNYEEKISDYKLLQQQAQRALVASVRRHGLHGIQVYPGQYLENASLTSENYLFMAVSLTTTKMEIPEASARLGACHPSPEARNCRELFQRLVRLSAEIAGISGNLYRLLAEYRRTERRARALENVVIPEMSRSLREITTQLEELDQEDIVRVHLKHR
jgi:V/A-type H+-transporting ATPase subunit D